MNGANSGSSTAGPRNSNAGTVGNWMNTILTAMGSSVSDDPTLAGNTGITKPIDILCLQEVNAAITTSKGYADALNAIYSTTRYKYGIVNGGSTGSGTQGIVYNSEAVQLVAENAFGTASLAAQARQTLKYQLRPVGYDSSADIYIYNMHTKSANDGTSATRRNIEATAVRADADALGAGKNIIYLGDYNVYTSSEAMYQTFLASGNGQAFDPINKPGSWTNNSSFTNIHTQSPFNQATATRLGTGFSGTTGGMDDRFDIELVSSSVKDGHGVSYITNSYQSFGNNGTHGLNNAIYEESGNTNTAQPVNVLEAMAGILDHSPTVVDYTLPAKMTATAIAPAATVIVGASAVATLSVSNSAPVSYAIGADVLTYSVTSSGSLTGSASSTATAMTAANTHVLTMSTAAPGVKTGTITVNSTSESVANGTFSDVVSTTVQAHAHPSFLTPTAQPTLTIDFGTRAQNSAAQGLGTPTSSFSIRNLADASGFSSKLDLDSIIGAGSTAFLTTNAGTFSNLAAAGAQASLATLSTSAYGQYTATYTFNLSDENLPGATATAPLTLTLIGRIAMAGDANIDGTVNLLDFNALASHFGATGQTWSTADFNGDGSITTIDFNALANHFNQSYSPGAIPLGALIPEPSMLGALIISTITMIPRRRRNSVA